LQSTNLLNKSSTPSTTFVVDGFVTAGKLIAEFVGAVNESEGVHS
jgi:hypothetical protein